jgi:hypothetical protein
MCGTLSDCAYHVGNVKVEEDLDMQEEEEVNVKTENGVGSEEEECIGIKDEDGRYSEEEEEEKDVDTKEEVSVEVTCYEINAEPDCDLYFILSLFPT